MPHPNPITAAQVEADIVEANAANKKLSYMLWDGEHRFDLVITTCVYGFPSIVILDWSYGSGIQARQWNSYGTEGDPVTKVNHYQAMFDWIAGQVNECIVGTTPAGHPLNHTGVDEERYGEWQKLLSDQIGYTS